MPKLTQATLLRYLQANAFGLDRAKTDAELREEFGVGASMIRALILELRRSGKLICSAFQGEHRGYYIPRTRAEAVQGISHLVRRVRTQAEAYEAQRRALARDFPEQPSLFDDPMPPITDIAITAASGARTPSSAAAVARAAVAVHPDS